MNVLISFLSGIVAAFTPCIIVLIPLALYRFFDKKHGDKASFINFIIGFMITYLIIGLTLGSLFSSSMQNGFRLGLGLLFIVLGILSFMNKINPLQLPFIKNAFIFGGIFAFIVAANPCTLPYIGVITSLASPAEMMLHMTLFGIGLLVPAIIFALFGQAVLNSIQKKTYLLGKVHRVMSIILILSGVYLVTTLTSFGRKDIIMDAIFLVLVFAILLRSFFIINTWKDFRKPKNMLLILALAMITGTALYYCDNYIQMQADEETYICGITMANCPVCVRCAIIFGIATALGFASIIITNMLGKNKKEIHSLNEIKSSKKIEEKKQTKKKELKKAKIQRKAKKSANKKRTQSKRKNTNKTTTK
ncbi:MAG: cytochrome c biogenesis CcdA family protein [Candidatus Woesearchaeota archaeon]